nr:MAG TPA: hypothetical protein [Caudoviricetes sp.]
MASKVETEIREEFMSAVRELFEGKGEDVLQVKSGTISIPWARGDDEGYLNIAFSIPKGERDKENKCYIPYDGYEEAQNYAQETEAKRAKKAETAKKKAEKIARDEKNRAEARRKREEREKEKEESDA